MRPCDQSTQAASRPRKAANQISARVDFDGETSGLEFSLEPRAALRKVRSESASRPGLGGIGDAAETLDTTPQPIGINFDHVLELLCQRQIEIVNRLVYFRRVLIANRDAIHTRIPERELHCGLAVCTLGERALAHQLHADYAHSVLADLLHMCNHFVYISQAGSVVVFGIHPHALMIHPDHGNFQPLVFRHPAQRGESMNRRAVRQHRLFGLSFGYSILPSEAVGRPRRCMLPVQKDYVEVVGFGGPAQLVDFFLRIHAVMGRDLGHQPIAIAWDSL
jgi:hypothetical protein